MRKDLEVLVGKVDKITRPEDVVLKVEKPPADVATKGVVQKISRTGLSPIVAEPRIEKGTAFYAKLRAEGRTDLRECLLAAFVGAEDYPEKLPKRTSEKWSDWDDLCECVIGRLLWDYDFAMGDQFLDLPPDAARAKLHEFGIDPDYYLDTPPEPDEKGLIAARQTLARLLGLSVPDDDGLYPSLSDLYHDLFVGSLGPGEGDAWTDHPWLRVVQSVEPSWDCDLATWQTEFAGAIPSTAFQLNPADTGGGDPLPEDVRVERTGGSWVVRMADGSYWEGLVENGWTDTPDENNPVLTFPTKTAAVGAFLQANRMYEERAARQEQALNRLDELDAADDLKDDGAAT